MALIDRIRKARRGERRTTRADHYNHALFNTNTEDPMKTIESSEAVLPPRKLTEILVRQARDLQMLPDVAVRAVAVADDPNSKIEELVGIVSQDVQLTTNILSLCNSPLFAFGRAVANLQGAITRLGFRQTKNMILASCYTSMLKKMNFQEMQVRDLLGKHTFLTGVIGSKLNSLLRLGMQGEEFTAGLLHDVGRTLLAVSIPFEFEKLDPLDFVEDGTLIANELKSLGTTHAEVGAWFLQRNHLPEELISVARHHHNPADATKFKRLVALVAIADDMANYKQRKDLTEDYDCTQHEGVAILESLGVEGATEKIAKSWEFILDTSAREVGALLKL